MIPVCNVEAPAVNEATPWNNEREMAPNIPIPSSMSPKVRRRRTLECVESFPPARLPSPSPSIKTVTMTVTDSILTP